MCELCAQNEDTILGSIVNSSGTTRAIISRGRAGTSTSACYNFCISITNSKGQIFCDLQLLSKGNNSNMIEQPKYVNLEVPGIGPHTLLSLGSLG